MFETAKIIASTKSFFARLSSDKRAVTAMEYGLIAALVAVVIIAGVTTLGTKLSSVFSTVSSTLPPG